VARLPGLLAGVVVSFGSYGILTLVSACLILPLLFATLVPARVSTAQSTA